MRVDEDAAFRTREAAKSAARDSPNILAWGSADVLLDGLFAAEPREPLPGPSAASRACVPRPACILSDRQRSVSGLSGLIAPSAGLRPAARRNWPSSKCAGCATLPTSHHQHDAAVDRFGL